ncbi:MAG TPA: sigma-70 family RNA polymerase sigma factor [Flavobacteriaceae bacterium]|nr:sigma-70 family RNA polymerase sigma factor [Flavobacteriaceae bacterium]
MELEDLIAQCKKQDREAQSLLYNRYADVLFGQCLKYAANYDDAKDHLQDSFITIFAKINQYKGKGSFEGWMKRIAINTVLQSYRKKREVPLQREELLRAKDKEDDFDLEGISDSDLPLSFLFKIVQELPERYRLVFNLYALDGYSHKEIAEMLDIAEGTSKSNLFRARANLEERIKEYKKTSD